jgi:hypothetical protein
MSSVLVIQPRKILQHATAIALFPEHDTRMSDAIPEDSLAQCDAVIVDAVALREKNALPVEALSRMSRWGLPIVWIDGDPPNAPAAANITVVKRPASRDELRAALATSLGRQLLLRPNAEAPAEPNVTASGGMIRKKTRVAAGAESQVIELVEVVEASGAEEEEEKK